MPRAHIQITKAGALACRVVPVGVAAFLLATAAMKIESGHSPTMATSWGAYYVLSCIELALAAGILAGRRARRWSLWAVVVLCAAGSGWTDWASGQPCGCFGSRVVLNAAMHVGINSTVGLLCLLVLSTSAAERCTPQSVSSSAQRP
jgi:hypothetical protein